VARLLGMAKPLRWQLAVAIIAGAVGTGCGVALLAAAIQLEQARAAAGRIFVVVDAPGMYQQLHADGGQFQRLISVSGP
jgi:hypothetical protein